MAAFRLHGPRKSRLFLPLATPLASCTCLAGYRLAGPLEAQHFLISSQVMDVLSIGPEAPKEARMLSYMRGVEPSHEVETSWDRQDLNIHFKS